MNKLIVPLILLICTNVFGQKEPAKTSLMICFSANEKFNFTIYPSEKRTITPQKEPAFEMNSPEKLAWKFLRAKDEKSLTQLFYNDVPESYKGNKYFEMMAVYFNKPDLNYYELESKLEFSNPLGKFSIIKYLNHNKLFPKTISSFMHFEKINEKWYLTLPKANSALCLLLMQIQSDKFKTLIDNKPTGNKIVDEFEKQMNTNGVLNIDLFSTDFDLWMENKDKYKDFIDYFLDSEHSPFTK